MIQYCSFRNELLLLIDEITMEESIDAADDVYRLPLARRLRSRTVTKDSGLSDDVVVTKKTKKMKRSK